jgi:hypothetical protein
MAIRTPPDAGCCTVSHSLGARSYGHVPRDALERCASPLSACSACREEHDLMTEDTPSVDPARRVILRCAVCRPQEEYLAKIAPCTPPALRGPTASPATRAL